MLISSDEKKAEYESFISWGEIFSAVYKADGMLREEQGRAKINSQIICSCNKSSLKNNEVLIELDD